MSRQITVIVPVYNEEEILDERVAYLRDVLERAFDEFEIILSENGSTDRTKDILREQATLDERVVGLVGSGIADYGQALLDGLHEASFDYVSILELDYLDTGFLERSYKMLDNYDLIVGSKRISGTIDRRPWKRRLFTSAYNTALRLMFGLPMTETHGLKTMRRSNLLPVSNACVTRHAVFPSEMVIRAWMDEQIRVCEIPLTLPLEELRPARISASQRLWKTLADLRRLHRAV